MERRSPVRERRTHCDMGATSACRIRGEVAVPGH
jgi:hypothetical protein